MLSIDTPSNARGSSIRANNPRSGIISRRRFFKLAAATFASSVILGNQQANSAPINEAKLPLREFGLWEHIPLVPAEGVSAIVAQYWALRKLLKSHLENTTKSEAEIKSLIATELADRSAVPLGWAHSWLLREIIRVIPIGEKQAYSVWFSAHTALITYNSTHISNVLREQFKLIINKIEFNDLKKLNDWKRLVPLIFQAYKQALPQLYDPKQYQSLPMDIAKILETTFTTLRGAIGNISLIIQQGILLFCPDIPNGVLRMLGSIHRQRWVGAKQTGTARAEDKPFVTEKAAINTVTYISEGFINTIVNMALEQVKVLPLCQDAQESKHLSALLGLVVGILARLNISVPIEQELRKNTPLSNKIMTLLKAFVQPL